MRVICPRGIEHRRHIQAKCWSRCNVDSTLKEWRVRSSASILNSKFQHRFGHLATLKFDMYIVILLTLFAFCTRRSTGTRAGHVSYRSYRASNGAQKIVMRYVYMLGPRIECIGSETAAHVYTLSLTRARAAGRMQL